MVILVSLAISHDHKLVHTRGCYCWAGCCTHAYLFVQGLEGRPRYTSVPLIPIARKREQSKSFTGADIKCNDSIEGTKRSGNGSVIHTFRYGSFPLSTTTAATQPVFSRSDPESIKHAHTKQTLPDL
jgi:hypothetical protein